MSRDADAPAGTPEALRPVPTTVEGLIRQRLSDALGGIRGSLETTLPMLAFVISWSMTQDRMISLGAAGVLVVVLLLARLASRSSVQFVVSGVFAAAIAAFFALRSGNAEDAFLPGILTSLAYGVAAALSVVLRWPLVGLMIGATDPAAREGDFTRWRRNPAAVRVCSRLTLVLVAVYAIRVAIMGPLYLAENVAGLTVSKVVLGWPLWAAAVALMGVMLLRGQTPIEPGDELLQEPAGPYPPR
ncbi:DUF3159 domain-containing protein [Janibacter melonis]|uniref:DUF3159 domain-containing protein n=1 Tax=Janibacter melonis TaxID=262209 RepID=A0A5P8FL63_9MICO|nr:DUF3159 domain-containing protein [Janibacter melonis]QFQ30325.2 DUF3159 domain-containing protein [Janibacter melonis]